MMFGYSHCNTDEHFKVPVFWEILPLSEQNRMIKTPSPSTKFLILNISMSIYI